jgi:hypothetical protein
MLRLIATIGAVRPLVLVPGEGYLLHPSMEGPLVGFSLATNVGVNERSRASAGCA